MINVMGRSLLLNNLPHPVPPRPINSPERLRQRDEPFSAVHRVDMVPLASRLVHNPSFNVKSPQHTSHLDEELVPGDEAPCADTTAEAEAGVWEVLDCRTIKAVGVNDLLRSEERRVGKECRSRL